MQAETEKRHSKEMKGGRGMVMQGCFTVPCHQMHLIRTCKESNSVYLEMRREIFGQILSAFEIHTLYVNAQPDSYSEPQIFPLIE